MIAELNLLDWLLEAGQALFFVSLIYFFYLVLRFGDVLHHTASEGDQRLRDEATRNAYIAMWQGEPEHGAPECGLRESGGIGTRTAQGAR